MTDLLKKIFTVGVVTTTLFWCLGVASLVQVATANASTFPTLTAGQLVKVAGRPTIYVVNGSSQLMAIPSGDVFKSWNTVDSYKGLYTTITQAHYDSLPSAANAPLYMGFRPGSYVVKRESSDLLYVVQPGNVLVPITNAAATGLYGTLKNGVNMFTVSLANWASTYTVKDASSQITSAVPFNGYMWSVNGVKYTMINGSVMQVTEAGASANGLKAKFFHTQAATVMSGLPTGATIDGALTALTDRTQTGLTNVTTVSGSGLTVSVAGNTPVAATIVTDNTNGGQGLIPVLNLNFTASNDGDVVVKTLKLTRLGISADTDVPNMYLYDGNTLVGSSPSISTKVFTFNNSNGLFTVSRGSTKTITVKFDLVASNTSGKTIGFGVAANTDVVTGGGVVNGSFPANGNLLTTAVVSDLGKFTLATVSPSADGTVNPGNTGYEIWRFTATTQNQDVSMESLRFTLVGSLNVGDLTNFTLWDAATQMGSVSTLNSDKTITFTFPTGYKFTKGSVRNLSLRADVMGGSTRTFYASIQNGSDMAVRDLGYGVYLKHAGTDSFTVIKPANDGTSGTTSKYTVGSGSVSVSVDPASVTGNVASSTTGVTLGTFNVAATGEDVKISELALACTDSNTAKKILNVKLLVNGSQVGSTVATTLATADVCDGSTHTYTDWSNLGSTFIVRAGTTAVVTVQADLTGSTSAGETLSVKILSGTAQGMTSLNAPTVGSATARTLTIASGTLSAIANPGMGNKSTSNPTATVNAANVKIGSFNIIGGAGEDADVSSIALTDVTANTSYFSNYVKNVKLMHNGVQLGSTLVSPADGSSTAQTHTFNISPAVVVPKGTQYTVDIYADIKSNTYSTAAALVKVSSIVANGHVTGTSATYSTAVTLQNVYISTAGTLTVAINGSTPSATNLLMGAVDQVLGQYDLTAGAAEGINITQLVVSANVTTGATGTLKNVRLYDDTGAMIGSAVGGFDTTSASSTYAHAVFPNLSLTIPAGQTKTITVKADVNTYIDGGYTTTGQAVQVAILQKYTGTSLPITGTGAQSGAALSSSTITFTSNDGGYPQYTTSAAATQLRTNQDSVRANEFVLYRAKLNIAWASDTPTGLSSGNSSQTIAHFNVTNLANAGGYKATVKYMNFSISSTISQTAGNTSVLTLYKDSITATNSLGTTTFNYGPTPSLNIGNTGFGDSGITDVDVPSGTTKSFYVTMDTKDAAAGKTLSITIPFSHTGLSGVSGATGGTYYGIYWYDGVSNTTANDTQLPLTTKSFNY